MIKHIITSSLITVIACSLTYFIIRSDQKKTAVVDVVRLFNEYHMKIELEKEVAGRLTYIGHILDSLNQQIRIYKTAEAAPTELIEQYRHVKAQLDKEYTDGNQQINEQVWKRLNPLVAKYGKEKGLHLIIGANGMGSVLYNDAYYDLTNDLIYYANKNYEGDK